MELRSSRLTSTLALDRGGPGSAAAADDEQRHDGRDRRRRHPLFADWRYALAGRRRGVRRTGDRTSPHSMVDWYHPRLLALAVGTFALSGVDAVMTLILIGQGITSEANPIMDYFLALGVEAFVGIKVLVTGVGLVALVAYSNLVIFRRVPIDGVLVGVFAIYIALIGYEIMLLSMAS